MIPKSEQSVPKIIGMWGVRIDGAPLELVGSVALVAHPLL